MKFTLPKIFRRLATPEAHLKGDELHRFTINLELMLASGISLTKALDVFCGSNNVALATVSQKLHKSISNGRYLSQAMAQQPKSFSKSFCRLIESGEVTGKITDCLRRAGESQEKQQHIAATLKKATVYPAILLVSSSLMILLMLYLVFPMMLKVTGEVGVDPPALTQLVISLSSPKAFGSVALCLFVAYLLVEWELRNPASDGQIRVLFESKTPPGRFFALTQMTLSLRQLALMLETGTDLLSSIRLAREIGHRSFLLDHAYKDIAERVKAGQYLSDGFKAHSVFPPLLPAMVQVGEETGDVHRIISQFCDATEDDMETKINTLSAMLEPLLMGAMGFVVGTILLAAFLPVYQLVSV